MSDKRKPQKSEYVTNYFLRPEDRHQQVLKEDTRFQFEMKFSHKKPIWRGINFYFSNFILHQPIEELLDKHSQRTNSIKLLGFCFAGFYIGTLLFYLRYKLIHEKKWVDNYGQDLPYQVKYKYQQIFQYYRAYYIHFYRYKLFYFLDEQVIDPLNDNVLSPKSFDVYQFKRLIRAMTYDEWRDRSFDFLNIAEDDIEEFDDFV